MRARVGPVEVLWTGGGLFLELEGAGLLLDAPAGVHEVLGTELPRVHSVLLSSDRTRSVIGLLPLFAALEAHRLPDLPLELRFPLGAERGAMLAETWVRGWPGRYPVTLDTEAPGARFDIGPFAVRTLSLELGEPLWSEERVVSVPGMGVRVEAGGRSVAWIPASAPHRHVARLASGADLAVIEVGRTPWPRTERRWRMTAREALEACDGVGAVWLPGDDGSLQEGLPS